MEYIRKTTDFQIQQKTAVSIGKFDGMHRGHQKLLNRMLYLAKEELSTLIFTFDLPPSYVLHNDSKEEGQKTLMTNAERAAYFEHMGIDYLVECPFEPEIAGMEPSVFIEEILVKRLKAKYVVVGTDCHFGHQRKGDTVLLLELAEKWGYQVEVIGKELEHEREISSTYVREELVKGNMENVKALLGYPYTIRGEVLHGRKIGRTLGMPTTNLIPQERKLLPPDGVYASKTCVDGEIYEGITNIGCKPTIGDKIARGVETYLFDYEGDLYGKTIEVCLYTFRRPEMKFHSLDALKAQMQADILFVKSYFK